MKQKLEGLTKKKNGYKEAALYTKSIKDHDTKLGPPVSLFSIIDLPALWKLEHSDIEIHTTVPQLKPTEENTQTIMSRTYSKKYPHETWTHIYTDGSASAAIKNVVLVFASTIQMALFRQAVVQ